LSAVTDEIKANKLADTNIINDLLGFSSESQVSKMKFNLKKKKEDYIIVYYILCEQCHRLSVTKTDENN
jgi:hypothetical protein